MRFPWPSGPICLFPVRQQVWRLDVLQPGVASAFRPGVAQVVMPGGHRVRISPRGGIFAGRLQSTASWHGTASDTIPRWVALVRPIVGLTTQQRTCRPTAGRGASNGGAAGD